MRRLADSEAPRQPSSVATLRMTQLLPQAVRRRRLALGSEWVVVEAAAVDAAATALAQAIVDGQQQRRQRVDQPRHDQL